MSATAPQSGRAELAKTRQASRHLFLFVALFSMAVNLLMLTGPLYMLQVYDRVLGSRSVETLIALSLLATFLFAMMGLLDHVRGRLDPDAQLDGFILAHIEDEALRRERTRALSSDSLPLDFERTVLNTF